jgi:hypothetical protein
MSRSAIVPAACAISLALGLFFIFVWAPHPWGWEGFDHYHQLALTLAAGQPFPTMEVPWGYAYFAAAFYRAFGDRPWVLLLAQVLLNAALPWLTYCVALEWTNQRTAIVAAAITGLFSFNTIYASTQSSDAVCTVIFMSALVVFVAARRLDSSPAFAVAGLLTGLAPQFRPNLILVPLLLVAYAVFERRTRRRLMSSAVLLVCAAATLTPWVWRNYMLTGTVLPTSIHGGVQLWYGTLQVGPYLRSRAYNPQSVFEASVFEYTSLDRVPIVLEAEFHCTEPPLADLTLAYWSDADSAEKRVASSRVGARRYAFQIPPLGGDAVVYYYFVTTWSEPSGPARRTTPTAGARDPFVYFVSQDHLGDLDARGDRLDVFDVVRLIRHAAWNTSLPFEGALRKAGVADARHAISHLLRATLGDQADTATVRIESNDVRARVDFADGSAIAIPRQWRGQITELAVGEGMASTLMTSTRSIRGLAIPDRRLTGMEGCEQSVAVDVNQVFYRREPHMMRRYGALALDNIRRDPRAFLIASAYRSLRLFIVEGDSDPFTAHQFSGSSRIYAFATLVTAGLLIVSVAGVVIGWRRGDRIGLPILLIAYVPVTLAPVLINMRYAVTIQPLMFIFVAIAVSAIPRPAGEPEPVSSPSAG